MAKNAKNNGKKGGNKKTKATTEKVEPTKKCRNIHHSPPLQYQPKPKLVKEFVQTDPAILWKGFSGPVEIAGMRFRVTKKKVGDGVPFSVINVLTAPRGTELYEIGGSDVYVTVVQLHQPQFHSRLHEGSPKRRIQQRIWEFLDRVFIANGIKKKTPEAQTKPPAINTSASIEDFTQGITGVYCFDKDSPRAVFRVKLVQDKFDADKKVTVVDLMSVEVGHPIHGYVRRWSYVFHKTLAYGKIPNFKGDRAGDCQRMWEFLTDRIAEHRGMHTPAAARQLVASTPTVSYEGHA